MWTVEPATRPLRGAITILGDKSVSHRALLFGALASGTTTIRGLSPGEDVGRTLQAVRQLGCEASPARVTGGPWSDAGTVDCGNSGTTARLLLGALAGRAGATLIGDASLSRRPMQRVLAPLAAMGATISPRGAPDRLPLQVSPAALRGLSWQAQVASAQVKSAILLAGLHADAPTTYDEPIPTRDHTERLLRGMGAALSQTGSQITLRPGRLNAVEIDVPGDFSSAAFWLVAASIVPGSDVLLHNVGLNPTRIGALHVLLRMGADITIEDQHGQIEPIGTLRVRGAALRGTQIGGAEVPLLIDELPVLSVAAAFAEGETWVRDAAELRVKESDRVATTVAGLRALGIAADARPDGFVVQGGGARAGQVDSHDDHRIAMAFAVAGLRVGSVVGPTDCVATSYPGFMNHLKEIFRG